MTNTCPVVGLTGGIASGKSTVADRFSAKGIAVLDADQTARDVVEPGTEGFSEVIATFGESVVGADGRLDRSKLREAVFNDANARQKLEAIIHPKVRAAMMRWVTEQQSSGAPYCMLMIPLLVESGLQAMTEAVVVVDVSVDTQRQRLVSRDGIDKTLAQRMIDAQASRKQRLAVADVVIDNNGSLDALDTAVDAAHASLLKHLGAREST